MNKRELSILENALNAEITSALSGGKIPPLFQTKSKVAENLCSKGYLTLDCFVIGGKHPVYVNGYSLTDFGRMVYCMSCKNLEIV